MQKVLFLPFKVVFMFNGILSLSIVLPNCHQEVETAKFYYCIFSLTEIAIAAHMCICLRKQRQFLLKLGTRAPVFFLLIAPGTIGF